MTVYEPGTVAVVTWDNASKASRDRGEHNIRTDKALHTVDGYWALCSGRLHCIDASAATDVRPLVVLDLHDPDLYGCSAVVMEAAKIVSALRDTNSVAAHGIARQIEAQSTPPRILEPGLWGVVEAETSYPTRRWVHHDEGRWISDTGTILRWEDLENPILVRDGIEDGAK